MNATSSTTGLFIVGVNDTVNLGLDGVSTVWVEPAIPETVIQGTATGYVCLEIGTKKNSDSFGLGLWNLLIIVSVVIQLDTWRSHNKQTHFNHCTGLARSTTPMERAQWPLRGHPSGPASQWQPSGFRRRLPRGRAVSRPRARLNVPMTAAPLQRRATARRPFQLDQERCRFQRQMRPWKP